MNDVIVEKNKEESYLNRVIIDKDEEIVQYKLIYDYIQRLEKRSIIWLVCFSEKFRDVSLNEKIKWIKEVLKYRKNDRISKKS